jgi:hypothetical protein
MNLTQIHLIINHLPIIGSILGVLVLTHGIGVKSNQTIIAAYYIFVLCSAGAVIAYYTGEAAEESVEKIPGILDISIKRHEDFALVALISLITLGISSLIALFFTWKGSYLIKLFAFIILFISMVSFGIVARAGYLGGEIRHTEIIN